VPIFAGPRSFTGAIATPHTLATDAAAGVYRDGGTAVDAAIAAAAVLTVVYPHNVALGGDLIALLRTPDGTDQCVNASGWSGAAADVEAMRARHGVRLPDRGADTVTVPGGVRGWEMLWRSAGRLPWERLLAPAVEAAAGVAVAQSLGTHLADPENAEVFGDAGFAAVFRPAGVVLRTGDSLRQPALRETLVALGASGPDGFYTGALAARTVDFLRAQGSALDAEDFADFRPEVGAPIAVAFDGRVVMTSPPNTHGFVLLRALRAIDELGLRAPLAEDVGTLARIFHHANRLRAAWLADPRIASVDLDWLIEGELRAATAVGATVAAAQTVPHGDTVGVAAADSDGYAVSLIQSVYHAFGSGLLDPQTGILFHDRGTSFSLDAGSPNVLAPRKRPLHTLMPVMTTRGGAVEHVLATMGGQGQPQILGQILLRLLGGATPAAALAAPRVIVGPQVTGATVDSVVTEHDVDYVAAESLSRSSLARFDVPPHDEGLGQANAVAVGEDGGLVAATDPRADGSAVVVQVARPPRVT
jgi:gamma-glutamyltranspeptidase